MGLSLNFRNINWFSKVENLRFLLTTQFSVIKNKQKRLLNWNKFSTLQWYCFNRPAFWLLIFVLKWFLKNFFKTLLLKTGLVN